MATEKTSKMRVLAATASVILDQTPKKMIVCTVVMLNAALRSIKEGEQLTARVIEEHKLPEELTDWFRINDPDTGNPWAVSNQNTPRLHYLVSEPGRPLFEGSIKQQLNSINSDFREVGHRLNPITIITPRLAHRICPNSKEAISLEMKAIVKSFEPHQFLWLQSEDLGGQIWNSEYGSHLTDVWRGNRNATRYALKA